MKTEIDDCPNQSWVIQNAKFDVIISYFCSASLSSELYKLKSIRLLQRKDTHKSTTTLTAALVTPGFLWAHPTRSRQGPKAASTIIHILPNESAL
jgi:hypothetical protein